jgi:hypothetical protein
LTLTPLPKDRKFVAYKCVFKVKYNANGSVNKYKTHLVAQVFNQVLGIAFGKIFSPIVH